jgi:hypothetical protein
MKRVAKTIRIALPEEQLETVNNYFEKHPELIKQVVYGQAIYERIQNDIKKQKDLKNGKGREIG